MKITLPELKEFMDKGWGMAEREPITKTWEELGFDNEGTAPVKGKNGLTYGNWLKRQPFYRGGSKI
jgi:hypothetical protein